MKKMIMYLRRRLSLRLGLIIVLIITLGFSLLFDFLFYRGKSYLQRAAIERAEQQLDNTAVRISGIMGETQLVTDYLASVMPHYLAPDSLLAFSRRAVVENDFLAGMAISMEPNFFPKMGRYYSAYSLRQGDTITTVREGPFEYFEKVWYKTPKTLGTPCWVGGFDDYNEGTQSSPDYLTSYCSPMRDNDGKFIGSVTASLTLKWLSKMVTAVKPYPNSSAIMIDHNGTYLAHPDTSKLFKESIFSDADPRVRQDINRLGKAMMAGRSGMVKTLVDGAEAFILYRPLERTGWSIAIVCPASDVFARYNKLLYSVWIIIGIGLLLLLLSCFFAVRKVTQPLEMLSSQAQRIAEGRFDEDLPSSTRQDSVGRLTNSFYLMQRSLSASVRSIRMDTDELELRNKELARAYKRKIEADERKAASIKNLSHEIRTPLNIISGFTQVLTNNRDELPQEKIDDITQRIRTSAKTISDIVRRMAHPGV